GGGGGGRGVGGRVARAMGVWGAAPQGGPTGGGRGGGGGRGRAGQERSAGVMWSMRRAPAGLRPGQGAENSRTATAAVGKRSGATSASGGWVSAVARSATPGLWPTSIAVRQAAGSSLTR